MDKILAFWSNRGGVNMYARRNVLMRGISCLHTIFIRLLLSGSFVILGVLPARAGEPTATAIAVPSGGSAVTGPADFTVRPSVTSTTLGQVAFLLPLVIQCRDIVTGQLIPGCTINVSPEAEFGTGGHPHDSGRPAGCFRKTGEDPAFCFQMFAPDRFIVITRDITDVTVAPGQFNAPYISPEPSGHIHVSLTGTDPNGNPLIPNEFSIDVQIAAAPLTGLPASGDGFVMEPGTTHPQNNFALSTVIDALTNIPVKFRDELLKQGVPPEQVPTLTYTSLNLPLGGLFDICSTWNPSDGCPSAPSGGHFSHRFGVDADLRIKNILKRFRLALDKAIKERGFSFPARNESPLNPQATHWHLRAR